MRTNLYAMVNIAHNVKDSSGGSYRRKVLIVWTWRMNDDLRFTDVVTDPFLLLNTSKTLSRSVDVFWIQRDTDWVKRLWKILRYLWSPFFLPWECTNMRKRNQVFISTLYHETNINQTKNFLSYKELVSRYVPLSILMLSYMRMNGKLKIIIPSGFSI